MAVGPCVSPAGTDRCSAVAPLGLLVGMYITGSGFSYLSASKSSFPYCWGIGVKLRTGSTRQLRPNLTSLFCQQRLAIICTWRLNDLAKANQGYRVEQGHCNFDVLSYVQLALAKVYSRC